MQDYLGDGCAVHSILDLGCGVGFSTRALAELDAFPRASTILGMDLSPYMLAVAELRRR